MNRRLTVSFVAGIVNALIVYVNGYVLLDLTLDATGIVLLTYKFLQFFGMFILGAGTAYLLLRFGLVFPIALTVFFTAYSLWDHFSAPMEGFTGLYLGLWFVAVAIITIAAAIEYGLRSGLSIYPPSPLG